MKKITNGWVIGLLFGAFGCSGDGTPEASFAVADSAGVEVVTTQTPPWGAGEAPWTTRLISEIGVLDGEEAYLFGDLVDVALLPDGEVAVADGQTRDVRFYSESGEFLRRAGSPGEGPGEFQSFGWLNRCGEQLVAYDWQLRRTTPISFSGDVGDPTSFATGEPNRPPYHSTCLPDGSLLAVGWGEAPPRPDGAEAWFFSQRADLWKIGPGESLDTIGTYISSERLGVFDPASGGGGSGPHPLGRSVVFTGDLEYIYVGSAERLQVEVRDIEGNLERIVRGPDAELEISDDFIERYNRAMRADSTNTQLRTEISREAGLPDRYPAYSNLMLDEHGFIWVERFVLPWQSSRQWGVFAPDGQFLGHLQFPREFEMTDVASSRITGIATDEIGVARVRVYELVRN